MRIHPRAVGKVASLIIHSAKTGARILCISEEQADEINALAKKMGFSISPAMPYNKIFGQEEEL